MTAAEGAMRTACDFARELSPEHQKRLVDDWPQDWPPPEVAAWMLAFMLVRVLPGASFGFNRPRGEGAAAPSP